MRFDEVIEINGNKLTHKYIEGLGIEEREELIEPIFKILREMGFLYPDDYNKVRKEYKRLIDYKCNLEEKELFNNSSVATNICKLFCHSFYFATERGKMTMIDIFNDDELLKKVIWNRLGLGWYPEVNQSFNLAPKMFLQGMRSMRLVPQISIFKPIIAKHIYEKYSNIGDVVYDYSAGFGGRLLGAIGRKYIGVDPLTIPELKRMSKFLELDCELYDDVSENFRAEKNSIDLAFSSPPYFSQEVYSENDRQAYNKGEDYFYNVYWEKTLENINHMLKPGKYFILNVKNYPKMVEMAGKYFKQTDELFLRTVRSHLNKTAGIEKLESVYVFVK